MGQCVYSHIPWPLIVRTTLIDDEILACECHIKILQLYTSFVYLKTRLFDLKTCSYYSFHKGLCIVHNSIIFNSTWMIFILIVGIRKKHAHKLCLAGQCWSDRPGELSESSVWSLRTGDPRDHRQNQGEGPGLLHQCWTSSVRSRGDEEQNT